MELNELNEQLRQSNRNLFNFLSVDVPLRAQQGSCFLPAAAYNFACALGQLFGLSASK